MSDEKRVKPVKSRKPVVIHLEYELEYDGKSYEKIILHRPKGKHLKKLKQDAGMEEMLMLAAKVIELPDSNDGPGVPHACVANLDGADCVTITEQLGDFLESGQKIGKL